MALGGTMVSGVALKRHDVVGYGYWYGGGKGIIRW